MSEKKNSKSSKRKVYRKPEVRKFGSVKDLTKTDSTGAVGDAGAFPKMHCISAPPRVYEHRLLLGDEKCQREFQLAIERAVKPGDVVVDLGTGSGIHALFALRAGAKKVYALDSDPVLQIAKEVIAANGYASKVEFIMGDSRQVSLPERADVLISNIGFLYSLKCLPDAHSRFLKEGGRMLPSSVELSLVPYMDESFFSTHVGFWDSKVLGFDFSAMKKLTTHHPHYLQLKPSGYLASPLALPPISFSDPEAGKFSRRLEFTATKSGVLHALGGWYKFFDGQHVLVSTEPPFQLDSEIWTNFVLPLESPIQVVAGDKIGCEVAVDYDALPDSSLWTWTVDINAVPRTKQSSFQSLLLSDQVIN